MMLGSEGHERRMTALLRLTQAKGRYSRLTCEYLVGRPVSVEEVQAALLDVETARTELAAVGAEAESGGR